MFENSTLCPLVWHPEIRFYFELNNSFLLKVLAPSNTTHQAAFTGGISVDGDERPWLPVAGPSFLSLLFTQKQDKLKRAKN